MTLNKTSNHPISTGAKAGEIVPHSVQNLQVPEFYAAPKGNNFYRGCIFHDLLIRVNDRGPLSRFEKLYFPWLEIVRRDLRSLGAWGFKGEVPLGKDRWRAGGRCDLIFSGGLASTGIVEFKVTTIPSGPREDDIRQLARYTTLAGKRSRTNDIWGALAYVNFEQHHVRVFNFHPGELRRFDS